MRTCIVRRKDKHIMKNTNINLDEIRQRAAKIRDRWTNGERHRRRGLPPDTPIQVRDYVFAPRGVAWPTKLAP